MLIDLKSEKFHIFIIVLLATLVRLYNFPYFPSFTDEVREALVAYNFYSFSDFPLTSFSKYIGPLHAYFMAMFMWIFGLNIWIPRIISLLFDIAFIYVAFVFGKKWLNSKIGLLTALFAAFSPILILINSKIGWATCISPIFGLLTLIFLKNFQEKPSIKNALWIGVFCGILLNLHPIMLFFILPILIYFSFLVFKEPVHLIKFKYLMGTVLAILLLTLPLIIANLVNPNASVEGAIAQGHIANEKLDLDPTDYFRDLDRLIAQEEHSINRSVIFEGQLVPEYEYEPIYYVTSIFAIPFVVFLIGALLILINRNFKVLPLFAVMISVIVLTPFVNSSYFEGLTVRYFSVLLPLFDIVSAYALYILFNFSKNIAWRALVVVLGFTVIVGIPTYNLQEFYEDNRGDLMIGKGLNNDVHTLRSEAINGGQVYFVENKNRDSNTNYAIAEYIIKFGGVKNFNPINTLDGYEFADIDLIVLPSDLEEEREENTEPLLNYIDTNNLTMVYQGSAISIFKR